MYNGSHREVSEVGEVKKDTSEGPTSHARGLAHRSYKVVCSHRKPAPNPNMCISSPRNIHPKTHMEPKGPQTAQGTNPPGAEMDASPPPRGLAGRDLGSGHRDKGADAGGTGPRGEGSRTGSRVCGRGLMSTDVSSAGGAALPHTLQVLTRPPRGPARAPS